MTPEELAKYRDDKLQAEADAAAVRKAEEDDRAARIKARRDAVENAFRETVLPYLKRVQEAMGAGFGFDPIMTADMNIGGFELRMDGKTARLKSRGSMVEATITAGVSTNKPFDAINDAEDLTEENLSRFVLALINGK